RVVHAYAVRAAPERERRLHDLLGLTVNGHVALDEGRLAPAFPDEAVRLRGGFRVSLEIDRDARPVAREANRGGAPDPSTRASDQRSPPLELDTHGAPKLTGRGLEGRLRRGPARHLLDQKLPDAVCHLLLCEVRVEIA